MSLMSTHYTAHEIPDGAELVCVDNHGTDYLKIGHSYTVVGRSTGYVNIRDAAGRITNGWFWSRFKLMRPVNQGDD